MSIRRRAAALALAGGAPLLLSALLTGPALADAPGRDLAVVSARVSDATAATGQTITFTVVAENHGRGQVDQAVIATTGPGLTLTSADCAFGVSPDGPGDCEVGAPPSGQRFTTTYTARAGAPTRHRHDARFRVCTTTLSGDRDPVAANNCRSVTVRLVGRR